MGENRIKLGMSTDYLPIIDVGLYGTFLGDLWIKDEYIQDYKRLICEKAKEYIYRLNPDARIIPISAKTGEGMDELVAWIEEEYKKNRG